MDGDNRGLQDARSTLLILASHFTLTFKCGEIAQPAPERLIFPGAIYNQEKARLTVPIMKLF